MSKAALTIACLALFAAAGSQASHAETPTRGVDPVRWASFEYVNLWTSAPPLRFPLITTGDAAGGGRLGAPGTRVLLGDGPLSMGSFPAGRYTLGGWIDDEENFGGEVSLLYTGVRAAHFQAASNSAGDPLLAIPFSDVTSGTPQESSLVISQPGVRHGNITVDDANAFFSAEIDGLVELSDLLPGDAYRTTLVAGARMLSFKERFQLDSVSTDLSGLTSATNDIFMDKDSFFGGDFGLRTSRRFKRFTVELTGKAAIGITNQSQYITSQNGLSYLLSASRAAHFFGISGPR
ncbi:MAG TPA: BBP7 family outer membrane beta-barrel protein [Pirellulales bacterium]|nr:BBP7 family outer membrane beta-barrel protein [Pirellulales bacterium]